MATIMNLLVPSTPLWTKNKPYFNSCNRVKHVSMAFRRRRFPAVEAKPKPQPDQKVIVRRSGNYKAPVWSFDYIHSLTNAYTGDKYKRRADELKEQVKRMFGEDMQMLDCLELVDNLERLGISYHFEPQIQTMLNNLCCSPSKQRQEKDLYAAALEFRVFRQHGFHVPPEIFKPFMKEEGNAFDETLAEDTKGMLALYEACYLSLEGETKLDLAREFTIKHLKTLKNDQSYLSILVEHALELPLWWRVTRAEARWFIDACWTNPDMNPNLLEFAKLDFNIVQEIHQEDLKHVSRWWKDINIAGKLTFTRDRVVENFFWTIAMVFEPQYSSSRRMLAMAIILITSIDDIYDVYGTLEELELFTDAVHRWDVKAMDELPTYMRIAFLGLFNSINQIAYNALKEQDISIVAYLRKVWADLCKAYLQEARWYHSGYTPTVSEYTENARVSIGVIVMLMHGYAVSTNPMNKEALDCLRTHNLVTFPSMLLRFHNDLGTSPGEMERGDLAKVVQCYMKETGCSEEEARSHVWDLSLELWKKLNKENMELEKSPFLNTFARAANSFGRMGMLMYQHGDGHGLNSSPQAKHRIVSSLFTPIVL